MYEVVYWTYFQNFFTLDARGRRVRWKPYDARRLANAQVLFTRHNPDGSGISIHRTDTSTTKFAEDGHRSLKEYLSVDTYSNIMFAVNYLAEAINSDVIRLFNTYAINSPFISFVRTSRILKQHTVHDVSHDLTNALHHLREAIDTVQDSIETINQPNPSLPSHRRQRPARRKRTCFDTTHAQCVQCPRGDVCLASAAKKTCDC